MKNGSQCPHDFPLPEKLRLDAQGKRLNAVRFIGRLDAPYFFSTMNNKYVWMIVGVAVGYYIAKKSYSA